MTKKILLPIALISAGTVLSGCDTLRHTLGLDHYQPDEFSVAVKPELKLPPDLTLRPPAPGQPDRGYVPEQVQAQKKLYGQEVTLDASHTKDAEQSLITHAAKDVPLDPNIRQKINAEAKSDESVMERIKNFKDKAVKNLTLAEDADVKTPGLNDEVQIKEENE